MHHEIRDYLELIRSSKRFNPTQWEREFIESVLTQDYPWTMAQYFKAQEICTNYLDNPEWEHTHPERFNFS